MFRLSLVLQAIAICVFFLSHPNRGGRLSPNQEEDGSLAQTFLHSLAKQERTRLKSNSIQTTVTGQDSDSDKAVYFANHFTYSGGPDDSYYGLLATMDVYGHKLERGQLSATGFWISHAGDGAISSFNSVGAGWHIYPEYYGDSHPHFYIHWTRDGHKTTGCYNMDCPGFVPANGARVAPGAMIDPVSDANHGRLQNMTLKVFKEKRSGDWWVYYGFNSVPTAVGYYPRSLFTYLSDKATDVSFGGLVAANRALPTPPMGSGALPNGQGRAASFRDLRLVDSDGRSNPIMKDLPSNMGNNQCYSIDRVARAECFYGGPGGCVE